MSLEYQIAECMAKILSPTAPYRTPVEMQPLYDELQALCDLKQALNEHNEECLCAHCALEEYEAEEAELHAELLAYESPRPDFLEPVTAVPAGRPAPLKRSNALGGFTETGANASKGGAPQPETPVYTPDEEEGHCECRCPCGESRGADCDCWEDQYREWADDSDHRDCYGALYTLRGAEVIYDDECNFSGNDL